MYRLCNWLIYSGNAVTVLLHLCCVLSELMNQVSVHVSMQHMKSTESIFYSVCQYSLLSACIDRNDGF